jgi:nucleoside-diphosphate-sugar epimerase
MDLTIVGCGYVGLALAERLQPRLKLTLTTTSSGRLAQLSPLADRVKLCDATDPAQLLNALRQSSSAVFCLGPKGDRQVDANGYRHTFVDSFRCLTSLLPQLPELRQIVYTGSCSVYGDAEGNWVDEQTPPEPGRGHGDVLLESEQLLSDISDRRVCILRLGALFALGAISIDACAGSPDWNALAAELLTATGCMWPMLPVPWKQLSMLNGPA